MKLKNCAVITGASSGIGLAVAASLALAGYAVVGVGRSEQRNEAARQHILAAAPGADVQFYAADLMQQRELGQLADTLREHIARRHGGELALLVNNAGCVRSWYMTTNEGYEQQFALNHLAGHALSLRLLPQLMRAGGRILFTASASHKGARVRWRDLMLTKRYGPLRAYKQSKLCNVLAAFEFDRRFKDSGVRAFAVDPGLVQTDIGNKETDGLVNWVWRLRKKRGAGAERPAETYRYLASEPQPGGLYYFDCRPQRPSRQVNAANAARLFALSNQLCGLPLDTEVSQ